jgi:hypothetical protein
MVFDSLNVGYYLNVGQSDLKEKIEMAYSVTKKQAEEVLSEVKWKYRNYISAGYEQPKIVKNFEWSAGVVDFAIVWEGGPSDWTYEAHTRVKGVWTEPYTSWAVAIYAF